MGHWRDSGKANAITELIAHLPRRQCVTTSEMAVCDTIEAAYSSQQQRTHTRQTLHFVWNPAFNAVSTMFAHQNFMFRTMA